MQQIWLKILAYIDNMLTVTITCIDLYKHVLHVFYTCINMLTVTITCIALYRHMFCLCHIHV